MRTIYLFRHGQTLWNAQRRYIGSTDQSLSPEGRAALAGRAGPPVDRLWVSPLRRCRETAAMLYPGMEQQVVEDLRECAFGVFEGRTYEELRDDPAYRRWLDSAGEIPPPGGEGKAESRARVLGAFLPLMETRGSAALVVHGGTIMTLLEAFEVSHRFYDWQPPNGGGWRCRWQDGTLRDVEKL